MITLHNPRQNHLLAALHEEEYDQLLPHLEYVQLPLGEILYESGQELSYAYFPTTCIFSLQYVLENGASAELAGIGKEGLLGVTSFMGGSSSPNRAFVRAAGEAYRIKSDVLKSEFNQAGETMRILLLYTQALITQISQIAVCNRRHTIEQQLCRWLLQTHDRSATSDLAITQELIAGMLGVRREGITEAAQKLQSKGLIHYRRGHIKVFDRMRLEEYSCECYKVVQHEFKRLFSDSSPFPAVPAVSQEVQHSTHRALQLDDEISDQLDSDFFYGQKKITKKSTQNHRGSYVTTNSKFISHN